MGFDDFIAAFSNEELNDLAADIRANEIDPQREADLRGRLEDVSMRERQAAFDEKPAIVDVLVALGLEFEFPDGEIPTPDEEELREREEEEVENGAEIEEFPVEPQRPEEPGVGPPRGRRQPTGARPTPFGAQADKEIADQFFRGNTAKGNAWMSAEQERLTRFPDQDPAEFWMERGESIWGGRLSMEEFVNPRGTNG